MEEYHPERHKYGRVSQNLGSDDISVDLLQNKDKYQKIKPLHRILQYNKNNKGRDRPDKRSEKRNDICHADDHREQHCIRHFHNGKNNIRQHANNRGIQQFSGDKAAEDLIALAHRLDHKVGTSRFQNRINNFLRLTRKCLFAREHIDRDDHTDQYIGHKLHTVDDAACNRGEIYLRLRQQLFLHKSLEHHAGFLDSIADHRRQLGVPFCEILNPTDRLLTSLGNTEIIF